MERLDERVKRYLTFATGVFECLVLAGVVYGWPSLVFVLKREEFFANLCLSERNASESGSRNATVCNLQDERFTLIFTIATFAMPFGTIATGFLLDYCGTLVTRFLAILLYTSATLMIAFSTAASAGLLFPAISLLGVGGLLLLVTNIQVGNLFGSKRSTVITLYNGAFDSSAVVLLVVKVLYETGIYLKPTFLFISCLSFLPALRTVFLLPRLHIPYPLPEDYTYGVSCEMFCRKEEVPSGRVCELEATRTNGELPERKKDMEADAGDERGEAERAAVERESGEERDETDRENNKQGSERNEESRKGREDEKTRESREAIEREEAQEETAGDISNGSGEVEGEGRAGRIWNEKATQERQLSTDGGNLQFNRPDMSVTKQDEEVLSFRRCVFSRLFLTHVLWISLIQLRLLLFIGTMNTMLKFLSDGDLEQVSRFTNAFGITQLCGIFFAPWNGLILDRHKGRNKQPDTTTGSAASQRLADLQSAVLSLAITVTFSVLFSLCAAIPVLEVQYLTFILHTINRAFLYGGVTAFVAISFPPCHFGKLFGTTLALASLVSLLQYPCLILVNGPLQGNPLYINIALIALVILTYAHPINVYFYVRQECRKMSRQAATDNNNVTAVTGNR